MKLECIVVQWHQSYIGENVDEIAQETTAHCAFNGKWILYSAGGYHQTREKQLHISCYTGTAT